MANDIKHEESLEGKISSFWELTGENAIEIPIIQRDYAQGRTDEDTRQVRVQFVKNIIACLEKQQPMQLDFVYGSLIDPAARQDVEPIEIFTPLDGQQRLTLLFLFHWFVSLWNESDFALFKDHLKSRFSYRTRESSTEFCAKLIDFPDGLARELRDKVGQGGYSEITLSKVIKNEGWFHEFWQYDPTIAGMLVVLDTIKEQFQENDVIGRAHTCFKELLPGDDGVHPLITFQLLYLNKGDLHMSDELYIKMNSRGKRLSPFEIFKARFEAFIRDDDAIDSKAFSAAIDHVWADKFWAVRNHVKPTNAQDFSRDNTDEMMMNLIKASIANSYALLDDSDDDVIGVLFEAKKRKDITIKSLTFFGYEELGVFHEIDDKTSEEDRARWVKRNHVICQSIIDAFSFFNDMLTDDGTVRKQYAIPDGLQGVKDIMKKVIFSKIDGNNSQYSSLTYRDSVYFYAYSKYSNIFCDDVQNSGTDLTLWMRFVRNIVESADIDVSSIKNALIVVDRVLRDMKARGIPNINSYLDSFDEVPYEIKVFPPSQIKEELMKAWLIRAGEKSGVDWLSAISEADNVASWPGRSGYLFFFTGLNTFSHSDIKNMNVDELSCHLAKYKEYLKKMEALEPELKRNDNNDEYLVEKALLCYGNYAKFFRDKGDYKVYCLMDRSVGGSSYSWRDMLQYNGISPTDSDGYLDGVAILKKVLDDEYFKSDDVAASLSRIIEQRKTNVTDWRLPVIEEDQLLDFPAKDCRFFWLYNDNNEVKFPSRSSASSSRYEIWSTRECNKLKPRYKRYKKDGKDIPSYYGAGGYFYLTFYDANGTNFSVNFWTEGKTWQIKLQKYDKIKGWDDATKESDLQMVKSLFGDDATDIVLTLDYGPEAEKRITAICDYITSRYMLDT